MFSAFVDTKKDIFSGDIIEVPFLEEALQLKEQSTIQNNSIDNARISHFGKQ